MISELNKLMIIQEKELKDLLELLNIQYKMILQKDLFGLEGIVDKINECGKKIAKKEMERRHLIGESSISQIVNTSENEELKNVYYDIQNTVKNVIKKKDTNDIILKQRLMFTNKMINIMNPNREIKTYNSYGNLSR